MNGAKTSLMPRRWYCFYHKETERMINVQFLGEHHFKLEFTDGERQRYLGDEFYFWKRTE